MNKRELRKLFLEKRKSLTEAELLNANQRLYHLFFQHVDLSFVNVLHIFLAIEKNKEPDTWQILDRVRREFPNVRISVPKINSKTSKLENIYFEGLHQLEQNALGIPEPKQGVPTPPEKIDMVLVPLLAVDQKGNRVGYGKGFYDKFLSECRPDCRKVGLSFFEPVESINDIDDFDVKLDACITPSRVFIFV